MSSEDTDRFCRRLHDSPNVADSKLVPQTSSHVSGSSKNTTVTTDFLTNAGDETRGSPLAKKLVLIVCRLSGSPTRHTDFLKRQPLLTYRQGTTKQYSSYIKRWATYCRQNQIDPVFATVPQALDFFSGDM